VNTADARELFARHLDLSPLRHRPRGVVKCIFHRDKTASLSVDVDKGVFHCFGCAEQGGVRRFAQLVGERAAERWPASRPWESELQQARRRVIDEERWRQMRMAEWAPLLHAMTWLRTMERLIASVRARVPDDVAGWEALDDAAVLERFVDAKTAEIEGLLAAGRVA
jgi:hypothetical protein